ncbi:MAG: hypothetical protein FJ303_08660 [Planctomycetes bacterium]|nr:hypothetical protein [Planctomycetota bacterium]
MLPCRFAICLFSVLLTAAWTHAQGVDLTEAPLADRFFKNELAMELDGKITIKQAGKDQTYPHKARAKHVFLERYLDAGATVADKVARYYAIAESTMIFNNNDSSKRSLPEKRRFLVAHRIKGHVVSFSPDGALTRDEIELTEHLDTMALGGLLPGKTVDLGATWTVPNAAVLALCELDGIVSQKLTGTLVSVRDQLASIKLTGTIQGINLGAEVAMVVNAELVFDIKQQRVVSLLWNEKDDRQQGPITPALTADVTIKLTRTVIEEPEQLNKFAMVKVPTTATPPSDLTMIRHEDAKQRFEMKHAREWHVTSPEDSPQLVMRYLERGDFLAQVTATAWKKIDVKNVISLDGFADEMAKTPGWTETKEIERKQLKDTAKGHHLVYRVAATGELDGTRTVQYFYLIVSPRGEQLIVTFSVVPQHVERLGVRDLDLIREIVLP